MPRPNVAIRTIFCRNARRTVRSSGTGMTRMARSVMRLIEEPMYHQLSKSKHFPGTVKSHRLRRGMQARVREITWAMPKATMNTRKMSHSLWNGGSGKTRRYCSRKVHLIRG